MALPRPHARPGLRQEILASERRMLEIVERLGPSCGPEGQTYRDPVVKAATAGPEVYVRQVAAHRRRIDDLQSGRAVRNLSGSDVGLGYVDGRFTLTETDELIEE